jgi:hypothetical protein
MRLIPESTFFLLFTLLIGSAWAATFSFYPQPNCRGIPQLCANAGPSKCFQCLLNFLKVLSSLDAYHRPPTPRDKPFIELLMYSKDLILTEWTTDLSKCCNGGKPFTRSIRAQVPPLSRVECYNFGGCERRRPFVNAICHGDCCYNIADSENVSARFLRGHAEDSDDNNNVTTPASGAPDRFTFIDGEGNEHDIRIPEGRYWEANEYYNKGDWENLTAYPAWEDDNKKEDQ